MRRLIIIIFTLAIGFLQGQTQEQFLQLGNESYTQQKYVDALINYHTVADSGLLSTALFYNMGNSYFRLGKTGMAILYYEKALQLSPKDQDIEHNLLLAEGQKIDVFEEVPTPVIRRIWRGVLNLFSAKVWANLGLCLVFVGATLLVLFLMQKSKSTLSFSMYLLFGILGLAVLFIGYQKHLFDKNNIHGILVIPNTYVKSEPKGQDLFIIHEGSKFLIEENFEDWTKIRLSNGKSGWALSEGVEKI